MRNIIVDAGPLIALFRKRDKYHRQVIDFIAANEARLISSLPVVAEACHFLDSHGKIALLAWVRRGGVSLQPITQDDFVDIESIIAKYADRDMDFADATLVWLASQTHTVDVMTIDRKDFEVYRTANGKRFNILLRSA